MTRCARQTGFAMYLLQTTLSLTGCELIEDLPWPPGHGGDRDASTGLDAGTGADADAAPDTSTPDAGCDEGGCADAGPACAVDTDCSAGQYCSQASGACRVRCDERGACIGPYIATGNDGLVTDGSHVCYAAIDPADGTQQRVQIWDGVASVARTIAAAATPRVVLVADGYCYYSAPALRRAALDGGSDELIQDLPANVVRAWLAPDHVWWTAPRGEGLGVYRMARTQGATPELVREMPTTHLWEAGNSTHLFRRYAPVFGSCAIATAPIADLTDETSVQMSFSRNCSGSMLANEESVFYNQTPAVLYNLYRIDLSDLTQQVYTGLPSYGVPSNYQLVGDFIYGLRSNDTMEGDRLLPPYAVQFLRAPRRGGAVETVFVPEPRSVRNAIRRDAMTAWANAFAVVGPRVVFLSVREPRLMVADLPSTP